MGILLVSGNMYEIISAYELPKVNFYNTSTLMLEDTAAYLDTVPRAYEAVVIMDDALSSRHDQNVSRLSELLQKLTPIRGESPVPVVLLTRDLQWKKECSGLTAQYPNLHLELHPYARPTVSLIQELLRRYSRRQPPSPSSWFRQTTGKAEAPRPSATETQQDAQAASSKKPSFLDRLRSKPKAESKRTATDSMDKAFERVSRGMSRVVAMTGHRGSGVTSSLVNVASEASKRGLSVMMIDLDIDYRTTNLYFNRFHEQTQRDEAMNASLIRTLARPQDHMITACHLKDELWLTSLGYSFQDRLLFGQYVNAGKLISLLSVLRSRFNLILIDMPMNVLGSFQEALIHIDTVGLCASNNIYSVITTLRNMEAALDKESIAYLNAKSKLLVTRYNDRSRFQNELFTPETVSKVMTSGLLDTFMYEVKVAGYVPYTEQFDAQIESDLPIVFSSRDHEQAYGNILLRLMEGTK
ncbi:AAA family ATPase [Paenibacillus nanensis]|nr:AAA family ATPase [Paenibacillus nanensis]